MYVGGLDVGTSGCKIVLYDEKGKFIKSAYKEYDVSRNNGLHEIDAEAVWSSVQHIIKEVASEEIASIAVTSFGETFVMLDKNDAPCAPSMLYTDPRGAEQCAALVEKFGKERLAYKLGTLMHQMYSLPKIMWIKENMSEAFASAEYVLLIQDFIVYKLSGVRQIDYSLAARTAAFDIKNKRWDDSLFDFAGIDKNIMSTPVPSGTAAGKIKADMAAALSLSEETVIVSGCHDQIAAITGARVFDNTCAMDGTGTVECIPVILDDIPYDYPLYEYGYSVVPHINGKYACYVLSYAGGATLKWFRDNFSGKSYAELDREVDDTPSDMLIMPHFAGAATPYMDSYSRASIIGVTFEHTASDLYKALMEGTAYEIMLNLEYLNTFGIKPSRLIATGGGANSQIWLQIKADVLNIPITALDCREIGAAGTAYLAGRAEQIYDESIVLAEQRGTVEPNEEKHKIYLKQFGKYKKIYKATKEILENE